MSRALIEEAAKALAAEGELTRQLGAELTDADAARIVWVGWTVKDVLGHVGASFGGLLRRMQGTPAPAGQPTTLDELNELRRAERADWPLARVLEEIERGRNALLAFVAGLGDAAAARPVRMSAYTAPLWRIAWVASSHERGHRRDVERALGRGRPGGEVAWLNVSKGGVPKLPVFRAALGELGLAGDGHNLRTHGGPTAALCLFSLEVIQALQREGHPIYPGAVGENVTVSGLDWAQLRPGDRLRVGPAVVELTRFTTPCATIKGAFADGEFDRIHAAKHPGQARLYASVVVGGPITVGDPVESLPSERPSQAAP